MKKYSLLFFVIVMLGCSKSTTVATKSVEGPSQADVDRVAEKIPNYSLEKLTRGKVLYTDNCGACHKLYKPSDYSEAKWKAVVPLMVKKVNKSTVKLSSEDQELISNYLVTMCDAPKSMN